MIALIITACAIAAPYNCKPVSLTFDETSVKLQHCIMFAQIPLARWVGEHPDWRIANYRCERAGRYAKA
jgi:hypothetical protein